MPSTKKQPTVAPAKNPTNRRGRKEAKAGERSTIYKEITADVRIGDKAIKYDEAKKILGWEEETDPKNAPFGNKFNYTTNDGKKVRLTNNEHNRPFYEGNAQALSQEVLRQHWRFNGEPIIIGTTGTILNGQHTLVGFIEAVDEWRKHGKDRWPEVKDEPVLEKLIVYGVAEDDATRNTMDTCKPRSLADVIYGSHYFKKMKGSEHKKAAAQLSTAVSKMWEQCGTHTNPYAPKRTHSESIEFLDKHPKLLAAVSHIFEEDNNENKIGKYLKPGFAAAALYLMGSSDSDSDKYYKADHPSEKQLDWSQWERACEFFVELASGNKTLKAVHDAIGELIADGAGSIRERWAVIAKAWNAYKQKKTVTSSTVKLEFIVEEDSRRLAETPLLGGIDVGEEGMPFTDLPEEVIEENGLAVRDKKHGKGQKGKKSKAGWKEGDTAWLHGEFNEPAFVTLSTAPYPCQDKVTRVQVDTPEGTREVDVQQLSLEQFNVGITPDVEPAD